MRDDAWLPVAVRYEPCHSGAARKVLLVRSFSHGSRKVCERPGLDSRLFDLDVRRYNNNIITIRGEANPELEDALFALGTGETTPILETELGFHLLYAAERSTDRPLSQQVRETVERLILSNWLEAARGSADLQRLD